MKDNFRVLKRNGYFFFLLFLLTKLSVNGQKDGAHVEKLMFNSAVDFIKFEDFESANEILQELDGLYPNNPNYNFNLGICYFSSIDKVKSLFYFLKARQLGYQDNEVNYYLGLAYRFNYDLDNATYYLQFYADHLEQSAEGYKEKLKEVSDLIAQIETSKLILDQRLSVGIQNMGDIINSDAADYVPILLARDSFLIFTSRRKGSTGGKITIHGTPYEDIYTSVKGKDGNWSQPKHFPGFNSKHHDANVAVNKNETELYVYKARSNGSIYLSVKNSKGVWKKPKPLKSINSRFWEGSIGLSPTEDTIFFSSDRPGGFGNSDLYFAVRNNKGEWTKIQNMGPKVNTPMDEDSPYMFKDGKTFFFSSRGHNSIGGYDVFSTKRNGDSWGDIRNIGFPINTIDDDIYFQLNSSGSFGYFTSFRHNNFKEKSIGEKDLFEIVRPNSSPVYFVFKGRVYDPVTKEPLPAIVTLHDKNDTTAAEQKLVVDINSGKFRYDLKFDNKYLLNVEVGDKVYFSKELYFPYQPDLFESFLDIPLKDVPSFQVKLQDLMIAQQDTLENVVLDQDRNPTIILVRSVPHHNAELRDLLLSNRVPVSFRKKIRQQLKVNDLMDATDEGELVSNVLSDLDAIDSSYQDGIVLEKLDTEEKSVMSSFNAKELFTSQEVDTVLEKNLSSIEQSILKRLSDYLSNRDPDALKVIDEIYYKNLNPDEMRVVSKMIANDIRKKLDSTKANNYENLKSLYNLIDHNRSVLLSKKIELSGFTNEAWGILYSIETSRFKYDESQQITFKGVVSNRDNNKPASSIKLLLVDERGAIYDLKSTQLNGEIIFKGLVPGKRYNILVDDYTITLLGYSKYILKEASITTNEDDYLKFYKNLSPEEKRSVDRIIANRILNEDYESTPIHQWEDEPEFNKLNDSEKDFIQTIRNYLSATTETEEVFYLTDDVAQEYKQLNIDKLVRYNRFIARSAPIQQMDSVRFGKFSATEKGYIDQLKESRKKRNIIIEDPPLSKRDADYWYILDELMSAKVGSPKAVEISGRIINKGGSGEILEVGLMNEFGQIVYTAHTDSQGKFFIPAVTPNKKYTVLINTGKDISSIKDYKLEDLKIEVGEEDFYKYLSDDEKRIVDRIIATNLANMTYQKDTMRIEEDLKRYNRLTLKEKEFIDRLSKHLYADPVTKDNVTLLKRDNYHYYNELSPEERNFINSFIIRRANDLKNAKNPFLLKEKDKDFYEKLTHNQLRFLEHMQNERRAKADIFAENPVLMADRAWVLLDSISNVQKENIRSISISGEIEARLNGAPIYNVPIMICDKNNDVFGIVNTDSLGRFKFNTPTSGNFFYFMAQTKQIFSSEPNRYELVNIQLEFPPANSTPGQISEETNLIFATPVIVFFNYNSSVLNIADQQKLLAWLKLNAKEISLNEVSIEGHADYIGTDDSNLKLSQRRADSVRKFLIQNGIIAKDIMTVGFGESKPMFLDKASTHLNRRAEVKIK